MLFLRRLCLVLQLCHLLAVRGHPEDPAALGVGRQVGAVRRLRRRRAQTCHPDRPLFDNFDKLAENDRPLFDNFDNFIPKGDVSRPGSEELLLRLCIKN